MTTTRIANEEVVELSALDQRRALERGAVTARELLDAHLAVIERDNAHVNAIVTLDVDAAHQQADAADERRRSGRSVGLLDGVPVVVKDMEETAGMRTTYGSPLHRDHVPTIDALVVERVRAAGGVVVGKTNVPEFATGSHTTNRVFGLTRNPYDLGASAGGSSGGSAAALASRMAPLATGSDMGGSLRNPAAFCNVVGLRPSTGRVPTWPTSNLWQTMIVNGPMARTVSDTALMLAVMAGEDDRCPVALPGDGSEFLAPLEVDLVGLRIGWSRTLGGLDIDPRVSAVLESEGRTGLAETGAIVRDVEPDIGAFDDVFRVLRAVDFAHAFGPMVREHPDDIGALVRQNVAIGEALSVADVSAATARRTELYARFDALFAEIDILAAPTTAVPAFDADADWVRSINGVAQPDYLEWMRTAWRITPTGFTAISVPCGFTPEGLPVGMQLIARPRAELLLLRIARAFEMRRPVAEIRPTPRGAMTERVSRVH